MRFGNRRHNVRPNDSQVSKTGLRVERETSATSTQVQIVRLSRSALIAHPCARWPVPTAHLTAGVEVNWTLEMMTLDMVAGDFRRYTGSSGQPARSMSRGPFAALAPGPE
jgi:hypothetical protein